MPSVDLSGRTLTAIHRRFVPDNFTFINKTGPFYCCNIILAQLLSPSVAKLLSTDATVDSFYIDMDNTEDFSVFISLLCRGTADISVSNLPTYLPICRQLGNDELLRQLIGLHELPLEFTPDNIVTEPQCYDEIQSIPSPLIEYVINHFT
jgi:hypothetical protein